MAQVEIRHLRGGAREVHARGALGRFEASGLSRAAFCRREGISTMTLLRWVKEFGGAPRPATGAGFVEVRLDAGSPQGGFELELARGRRLRIPPGFSVADLERLLALLDRAAC
jgi:hypothetical protein